MLVHDFAPNEDGKPQDIENESGETAGEGAIGVRNEDKGRADAPCRLLFAKVTVLV